MRFLEVPLRQPAHGAEQHVVLMSAEQASGIAGPDLEQVEEYEQGVQLGV